MADLNTQNPTDDDFSFLDLPDDELGKYSPDSFSGATTAVVDAALPGDSSDSDDTAGDGVTQAATENTADVANATSADDGGVIEPAPAPAADPHAISKTPSGGDAVAKDQAKVDILAPVEKSPVVDAKAVDYEVEYKKLLAPFKANGKDITVQGVDDAIELMQMGANYTKKMAGLKPGLAMLKMLENNGLLSEEKIGFLIDLSKKDSGAINKLLKDSGIDPLDLNTEKAGDYKPGTHRVDEREVELDAVLDELQTTPSYGRTIAIVSKEWDPTSKQAIADSPQLLKVINTHVGSGIYDLISQEIERERMFGRLKGLSDLDAYRQVGDTINARGGFDHLGRQGQPTPVAKQVVVPPKPMKVDDDKLKDKKRAASSSKPAATATTNKDFNPLALSDDEFKKLANHKYL